MQDWQTPELRRRPPLGRWQVFCDGSRTPGRGMAYSSVFWDPGGRLVERFMGRELSEGGTSVEAELRGVLLAVKRRKQVVPPGELGDPWVLCLDCQSLVLMLSGRSKVKSRKSRRLVRRILQEAGAVSFLWVPRSQNRDADQCTKQAYHLSRSQERRMDRGHLTAAELDARQEYGRLARMARRAMVAAG